MLLSRTGCESSALAIDTKAKRASVQAYLFGLMRPPPDGAVGAADRATVGWLYAGLTYAATVARLLNPMICSVGRMMNR